MFGKKSALVSAVAAAGLLLTAATAGAAPLAGGAVHSVRNVDLGGYPEGVAVDTVTHRVYVADDASENLDVVNGTTGKLITRVHVGLFPYLVAVDSKRDLVYELDYVDGRRTPLVVINGRTDKVIGSVLVGSYPEALEFDPSTDAVLVSAYWNGETHLYVVNGRTRRVVHTILVPDSGDGIYPDEMAFDAQTNTFYAVNDDSSGGVWVINAKTFAVRTFVTGEDPDAPLAVGNTLWLETYDGSDYVLDQLSASNPTVATSAPVTLPSYAYYPARDSVTHTTYLAGDEQVFAVRSGVLTTIHTSDSDVEGLVLDSRDGDLFVVNDGIEQPNTSWAGNVTVIRGLAVTQTVKTGNYSEYADIDRGTGRLYVANSDGGTLSILQAPVG